MKDRSAINLRKNSPFYKILQAGKYRVRADRPNRRISAKQDKHFFSGERVYNRQFSSKLHLADLSTVCN